MNVSALLQESPSGDFRNRQQAQKQQQQQQQHQHQQLQRQLTPQPQRTHDRRTSFDSVRDHDLKDREREPDPHRSRASSISSRQQIDLPFPISNSMSKLNQPSHGPGLGIVYPNDHPSSRASHHQLPPPSSLTGDLPDPGARLPPPRCVFLFFLVPFITFWPLACRGNDMIRNMLDVVVIQTLIFESRPSGVTDARDLQGPTAAFPTSGTRARAATSVSSSSRTTSTSPVERTTRIRDRWSSPFVTSETTL